jgi:hypothetical protein
MIAQVEEMSGYGKSAPRTASPDRAFPPRNQHEASGSTGGLYRSGERDFIKAVTRLHKPRNGRWKSSRARPTSGRVSKPALCKIVATNSIFRSIR